MKLETRNGPNLHIRGVENLKPKIAHIDMVKFSSFIRRYFKIHA